MPQGEKKSFITLVPDWRCTDADLAGVYVDNRFFHELTNVRLVRGFVLRRLLSSSEQKRFLENRLFEFYFSLTEKYFI